MPASESDIEKALAEGMASLGPTLPDNAYIAAAQAATPPMQEVARLAAIGTAMKEAFGDYFTKHEYDADAEWCLKHLPRPAAIAAALEDEHD